MSHKCPKCGVTFPSKADVEIHKVSCNGISFTMDMIEKLAKGQPLDRFAFECEICGSFQEVSEIRLGKDLIFPVCDNCKRDLKELILSKRRDKRK